MNRHKEFEGWACGILNLWHFKDIGKTRKLQEIKAWKLGDSMYEKKITKLLNNLDHINMKSEEINWEHLLQQ